jgi:hypothetical protein
MDEDLLAAVRSIAQSLQPHYWPPSISDVLQLGLLMATVGLVIATIFTVRWLKKYTKETALLREATAEQVVLNGKMLVETIGLRKAAQDQVDAAARSVVEFQKQTEQSVMPMVVLTTEDSENNVTNFIVKNMGNGAALNIWIEPFSHDGKVQSRFHHRSAIAASEHHIAFYVTDGSSTGGVPAFLVRLLGYAGSLKEIPVKITYNSISGQRYETFHTMMRTDSQRDLTIRFDEFRRA